MITKQKFTKPLIILTASAAAMLTPFAAQATDVQLSGQVNRLLMFVDNGVDDGLVHADNNVSGTRWRLKAKTDLGSGTTAGIYFENQVESNPSNRVSVGSLDSDGADVITTIRHQNVWFKGDWGKLTIGQGNGAANGSAEADNSGTDVVQYVGSNGDLLGGMEYGTSGITVGDARTSFDGLSRNDNIRYDGGSGPLGFAVSLGNGDKIELAGKFKTDNFLVKIAFWDKADSGGDTKGQALSASWITDGGFNLTGSFGSDDSNADDPMNIYLKAGYKMGKHAFAIDFGQTTDKAGTDIDGSSFSLAWVNNIMKGVQVYASYRVESIDLPAGLTGDDDVTALVAGARVKF